MSRLTAPSRRLSFSGSRQGQAQAPVYQEPHWKTWYKTARWRRLRQEVLLRDSYTCQRTGVLCSGKHPEPNSPVVNHRQPHRGNEALFWNIDNLETVTKAEHDAAIQREEQATRHHQGVWD